MVGVISTVFRRNISTTPRRLMSHGADPGAMKLWKNLTYFVAIPAVGLCMVNTWLTVKEEDHTPPEFVPYEHMRIRTKKFPWKDGNHSLIHNSHVNALPNGYEEGHH
ncbi:cytochrome c oxidase subunit 6A, mitochondrial-like [Macrosteles quadrilineatus]|uniref:cytochrome c oxidase subunit 6A, mitochondrial-like n=1 Tax=Macrosteles quadrilineatus TaxID=74068 RepID=UPI0023E0ADD6|nr:cytochrome c oxidase subunit 6A, mitochondrial-like [Macrosteles quadrilineatus]